MLLSASRSKRLPKVVILKSGSKPSSIIVEDVDLYLNVHAIFSEHFSDKSLYGTEDYVKGTIYGYAHNAIQHLTNLIFEATLDPRFLESGLVVLLVCSSGERCSVAIAEMVAKILYEQYVVNVRILHGMEEKWFKF